MFCTEKLQMLQLLKVITVLRFTLYVTVINDLWNYTFLVSVVYGCCYYIGI